MSTGDSALDLPRSSSGRGHLEKSTHGRRRYLDVSRFYPCFLFPDLQIPWQIHWTGKGIRLRHCRRLRECGCSPNNSRPDWFCSREDRPNPWRIFSFVTEPSSFGIVPGRLGNSSGVCCGLRSNWNRPAASDFRPAVCEVTSGWNGNKYF